MPKPFPVPAVCKTPIPAVCKTLPSGARVQYHLAGRLSPGQGVVASVHPSGVVELYCGTLVHPGDKIRLISPHPGRWPNRAEFHPDDQSPHSIPQDHEPAHLPGPRQCHCKPKPCPDCGVSYTPSSGNQRRCDPCRLIYKRARGAAHSAAVRAARRT